MYEVHIIETQDEPYGWYAESPQIPGFIMARDTLDQLVSQASVVVRELVTERPLRVISHRQGRLALKGLPDVLIRSQYDPQTVDARQSAMRAVEMGLHAGDMDDFLEDLTRDVLGDVVVVVALPSDTVGSISRQIDPSQRAVVLVMESGPEHLWVTEFGTGERSAYPNWNALGDHGWNDQTTLGEIAETLIAIPAGRGLLAAV